MAEIHVHTIPVRWSDFDRYGHVTNSAYVELAQEARLAFAEKFFYSEGHEFVVFVRRLEVDYVRPILPNTTEVTVETQVVNVGNTSFTTRQEIKDAQGKTCAVVECVQVTVDTATTSPREITKKEIGILSKAAEN
ncbi:acyl-CoA thioester hydrolase [Corynebacterium coyleae]|uniref:Acyl-CoA thioesterase n=1 Tax=Corynebacterium coyleae TaxID=53374 RepID=A0ABX8KX02_9CORY|nr:MULTISPECIES: acyl-CoA thioesterase [Corynebacterium]MDK6493807.1 acyl-CoA thioesterase [Corynebacterium coyleae]MDK8823246.1 acyl-CoA thioesterase [Corynebacterium coyleae]OFO33829.1 thioesterase [Corynebacterium sp. HMSC075D04]PLA27614.1 acyl-CoA thioesterase [Corynebacterium coyleae]PLA37201.1 acyl-CoA thioesterase [Corynebacterium coyleae]